MPRRMGVTCRYWGSAGIGLASLHMSETFFVHPTAEVAVDARVGYGARIWHQAQILTSAHIGEETIVGKGVYIDRGVRVGARVKIQNYALLYRGSVIEDDVLIGPQVVMTNDTYPRASNADGSRRADADWTVTGSIIHRGASLGAGCIVLPGVDVGANAMAGAGALLADDVPEHALVLGSPARRVGWVCLCGNRLDDDRLVCLGCSRAYRKLNAGLASADTRPVFSLL